jgi:hypothetical protein
LVEQPRKAGNDNSNDNSQHDAAKPFGNGAELHFTDCSANAASEERAAEFQLDLRLHFWVDQVELEYLLACAHVLSTTRQGR